MKLFEIVINRVWIDLLIVQVNLEICRAAIDMLAIRGSAFLYVMPATPAAAGNNDSNGGPMLDSQVFSALLEGIQEACIHRVEPTPTFTGEFGT